jgi:cell wall-associated NlpC family hydrolase
VKKGINATYPALASKLSDWAPDMYNEFKDQKINGKNYPISLDSSPLPGDILFFDKQGINHVGLYIGGSDTNIGNKFMIHSLGDPPYGVIIEQIKNIAIRGNTRLVHNKYGRIK